MKITKKAIEKVENAPKVYLIVCWARWGVQEYSWTGKWSIDERGIPQPIVYYYNDHNGSYEEYQLIPIFSTTTGICMDWSFYKNAAQALAEKMNEREFGEERE